jgi:hypothetical protein
MRIRRNPAFGKLPSCGWRVGPGHAKVATIIDTEEIYPCILRRVRPDMMHWSVDWAWSVPLIVLCVVVHVCGLWVVHERVVRIDTGRRSMLRFAVIMGTAALVATMLHAVEGALWAATYRILGALPDNASAMLYSISAMTSYGHSNLDLKGRWQMMGALEALNGMLLFGLTTAFLFAIIQMVSPLPRNERPRG